MLRSPTLCLSLYVSCHTYTIELKKRPSKEDIENSDWTSCCKGPILKKDLEDNLWVCSSCGKHHRISCRQRFDIFFGKTEGN